ncbi:hypothetical protein DFP72DRAFT_816992 [Ephemerocybe angulata]|uniref:Uncharacterized protein n=1 Tax=Ephemerocybe angulata TaxID=980116 RepID=A0A8H6HQA9_9AGAR|nr:hypothetical protein DFP72DRAFT_816992 [Tulosesus angulatus]
MVKAHANNRVASLIKGFTLPLEEFLQFMKGAGVVISGSGALHVVQPGHFHPADLDLYAPFGYLEAIHRFLIETTQYILVFDEPYPRSRPGSNAGQVNENPTGIRVVRYYVNTLSGKVINVIETRLAAAPSAVFMFYSTYVMNFITGSTVVCAYPLMVERHVGLLNTYRERIPYKMARCLKKYVGRGFAVLDSASDWQPDHKCGESLYCAETTRVITDGATLRILFGENGGREQDLIDPGLRWKLASRFRCHSLSEADKSFPRSGMVVSRGSALSE